MSHQNSNDSTHEISTFVTFACGAIAGAAVALMFAPATGRETRALVAQRSRRVADKGREMVNQHGGRVSEVIERGRDRALELGERVSQAVEQGKAGYRDAIRQGQGLASDSMKSAEEAARAVRGAAPRAADSAN